jgi:hypothetical protein
MKAKFLPVVLLIFFSLTARSQDYKTGIGVRISPFFNCVTVKHFFAEKTAVEGLLNIVPAHVVVVAMAEFSNDFADQQGLKWYYGLGGSIRFPRQGNIVVAADGILGLEYTFPGAPINLSLDWKPAVEFINGNEFYPSGFGFAVRFVFK